MSDILLPFNINWFSVIKSVIYYQDDILVFANTKVNTNNEAGLSLNNKVCILNQSTINHTIKVVKIKSCVAVMVDYYLRYTANYSHYCQPLYQKMSDGSFTKYNILRKWIRKLPRTCLKFQKMDELLHLRTEVIYITCLLFGIIRNLDVCMSIS